MAHDEPQPKDSPKRKRREPPQSQKAKTEIARISKDEMNMVEHPFASLSKETDARSIEFTWEGQHPTTGKTVQASWRVSGDPQLGLPTANDERIYLVLMELTRETGWEQTVHFTRHSLLKRLGWSDDKRSYQMLEQGLDRLATVTIHAQNAFWSPTQKSFYNGTFGILDTAVVTTERAGRKAPSAEPISFFKWNDIMFASLTDGNIRTLDLEFALSLRRPLSLRLYRYRCGFIVTWTKKVTAGAPSSRFRCTTCARCTWEWSLKAATNRI